MAFKRSAVRSRLAPPKVSPTASQAVQRTRDPIRMAGFLLSAAGRGYPPPALVAQGDGSGTPVVAPGHASQRPAPVEPTTGA